MNNTGGTTSAFYGVSVVAGVIGSIYLTPPLWDLMDDTAWRMLLAHYHPSNAQIIHVCFGWFAYLGTFFLIRMMLRAAGVVTALAAVRVL